MGALARAPWIDNAGRSAGSTAPLKLSLLDLSGLAAFLGCVDAWARSVATHEIALSVFRQGRASLALSPGVKSASKLNWTAALELGIAAAVGLEQIDTDL